PSSRQQLQHCHRTRLFYSCSVSLCSCYSSLCLLVGFLVLFCFVLFFGWLVGWLVFVLFFSEDAVQPLHVLVVCSKHSCSGA
uniref:Uncharacterized protein n=1 Tax=Pelusios castaneus TaxID=367368 RepID=A0A8C8R714_9SAUR